MTAKADHRDLFQRFSQAVGSYPVESVVELNMGKIAIVKQIHPHVPLTPWYYCSRAQVIPCSQIRTSWISAARSKRLIGASPPSRIHTMPARPYPLPRQEAIMDKVTLS